MSVTETHFLLSSAVGALVSETRRQGGSTDKSIRFNDLAATRGNATLHAVLLVMLGATIRVRFEALLSAIQ